MNLPHLKTPFKKLRLNHWFKLLPLATSLLLVTLTGGVAVFLHRYFYQTIAQARVVIVLKSQVAFNQVNLPLFHDVFVTWEAKKKFDPTVLEGFRDPFKPTPPAAPTTPSIEEVNATP